MRTIIFSLNHWSSQWADAGRGWEYTPEWLPFIREIIVVTPKIDPGVLPVIPFNKDLKLGDNHPDVMRLQKFLNTHGYPVSTTGAGSSGQETTYFGAKTKIAVQAFQKKNSITPVLGFFGPKTRTKVNELLK